MLYYVLKKYLAAPHRTWDLSSPTKDQTRVPWKQGVLTTTREDPENKYCVPLSI